jgi:hypothetical protein
MVDREWKELKLEAGKAAAELMTLLRPQLDKWAVQVAAGELDLEDVRRMIGSRVARLELKELTRVGLGKAQRDKLVAAVVDLAMKALSKA